MMRVRVFSLSLIIVRVLTALIPIPVAGQSPNTVTSIIVTDILAGDPVVGGTFTTDVQVSITNSATPEVGVMGVEIWLPFDSRVVIVDDFDDNPANGTQVAIKRGFFDGNLVVGVNEVIIGTMPPIAPPDCTTAGACVHLAASHTGGSGPITNKTGTVASVAWSALATGSPGIGIAMVPPGIPPGSVLSDPDDQPITISDTSVPAITVADAGTVRGVVKRQGAQTDHALTETVGITVDDGVAVTATTAADGSFSQVAPTRGTYTIKASYPGYLQSQKGAVYVAGAPVDIGSTKLVGGDVNADNCINILDIVSIIGKFDMTGLPRSDPEDINDDGRIDILDLTIAAGNFTRCGPTAWAP